MSGNFQSGVWVKDTLTARADGEQVTRFVNVGELKPDADHQQRPHLRVRFEVPASECAHREERRVRAARSLATDAA